MSRSEKTFLVVGGGSGIGAEISRRLLDRRHAVRIASRTPQGSAGAAQIEWDATAGDPPEGLVPEILHGLAYCPGTIRLKPLQRLDDEDFREDFEVNLLGAVRSIRPAIQALKRGEGSVVLFSTVAVGQGMPFHASIAAAKGAVEGFGRSLAAELAPKVRVNTIALSLTDTPLAERLLSSEKKREAAAARHPLGRVGTPEDAARLAVSLLDDELPWMTGQVLHLDGGLSRLRTG